jgi:hypothetical protein
MPGKIFSPSFGLRTSSELNLLATDLSGFFVRSFGQFLGGLALAATPQTGMAGEI